MPSTVFIQLKGFDKTRAVRGGVSVEESEQTLTIKNEDGKLVGSFNRADLTGWWIERDPIDLRSLSPSEYEQLAKEIKTYGVELPKGVTVIVDGAPVDRG